MKLKKVLLSTSMPKSSADWTTLLLRFALAGIIFPHGWEKITHFGEKSEQFYSFLGMGSSFSLVLCIIAEAVCAILLIIGLFTRFAAGLLAINFLVILSIHQFDILGPSKSDFPLALLIMSLAILFLGPGKHSLDNLLTK